MRLALANMRFTPKAIRNYWIAQGVVIAMSLVAFLWECNAASLRGHVNVDSRNVRHAVAEPERWAFDALATDMHVALRDAPEPKQAYDQTLAAMREINPQGAIGSYLSSRMVREKAAIRCYPAECLDPRFFAESELMSPEWNPPFEPGRFVDYRQPVARAKLVRLITNEAVKRGLPWLFTDNWVNDKSYAGFIPWDDTSAYMKELRTALKPHKVRLFCNVAISLGWAPDADIDKLAESCDGVSLEMPLSEYAAKNPDVLAKAVRQYKILLDKKVTVVFLVVVPNGTAEQIAEESRFLAGLAMVLNGPIVAAPVFEANPEWHMWPDRFGNAVGGLRQDGTTLSRRFDRGGSISVDCAGRTVTTN